MQQLGIGSFAGDEGNEDQNAYHAMMQVHTLPHSVPSVPDEQHMPALFTHHASTACECWLCLATKAVSLHFGGPHCTFRV